MTQRTRVLLLVSQHGHCLNDLLFRWRSGQLAVDIAGIVSNHTAASKRWRASYGMPFHHLPLPAGSDAQAKRKQESAIETLIEQRAHRTRGAGALHADPERRAVRAR